MADTRNLRSISRPDANLDHLVAQPATGCGCVAARLRQPRSTERPKLFGDASWIFDHSADTALCGSGRDSAVTDRRDRVRSCEHVRGRHR
jgi:hypothetical protein